MIKDHPLLGSGIGTYKYNTLKYQAEFFKQGENRSLYPHGFAEKAHNEYLQLWAEMGIVGLGIFIWLIISYFGCGIKILRKIKDEYKQGIIIGLMGSVVAVLIDGLFGFPLHLPATIILFWMALSLTVAFGESEKDEKKPVKILDNFNQENKKDKEKQNKRTRENNKKSNVSRFTPLLYILIISLTIFLCLTVSRPFIARIYWYYANREIKNENWDEAIKISEKGLKWDPYLGRLYYGVGLILQKKEIYNLALEYFEKTDKYTDIPSLPNNFAFIYLKKGELDKAVIKLKQAISYQSSEKSMYPLYSELGNVYLQLEKYKPAEAAFLNALKINPEFVNAHYGMAGAYLYQNRAEKALVILQKIIELAPNSKEAQHARDMLQQIAREKLKAPPTETDNP
jgi:tetratricopeptide (TPR) repeat protein